jgi:hypothetical protein
MYLVFVRTDGAAGAAGQFTLDSVWENARNANDRVSELGDENAILKYLG